MASKNLILTAKHADPNSGQNGIAVSTALPENCTRLSCCITTQKSAVLSYFAAEACNHTAVPAVT